MATSQITAAATSGRYMSDFGKSVSPALKLMKVLTTATDASEIPIAAGIPSSRTRPDVCRMNSCVEAPRSLPAPPLPHCVPLAYLQSQRPPARDEAQDRAASGKRPRGPQAAPRCLGSDKQLSISMDIRQSRERQQLSPG